MSPPDYTRRGKVEPEPVMVQVHYVKKETPKALLVALANGRNIWVPKSCIVDEETEVQAEGDSGPLTVKGWFAEREGIE